ISTPSARSVIIAGRSGGSGIGNRRRSPGPSPRRRSSNPTVRCLSASRRRCTRGQPHLFKSIVAQTAARAEPLSPFQRIWLADHQKTGGLLQPTFATFRLDGPLDLEITERVLAEIWRQHEALRMRLRRGGHRPSLSVTADIRPALSVVNLESLTPT